jgi:hypothetical protein
VYLMMQPLRHNVHGCCCLARFTQQPKVAATAATCYSCCPKSPPNPSAHLCKECSKKCPNRLPKGRLDHLSHRDTLGKQSRMSTAACYLSCDPPPSPPHSLPLSLPHSLGRNGEVQHSPASRSGLLTATVACDMPSNGINPCSPLTKPRMHSRRGSPPNPAQLGWQAIIRKAAPPAAYTGTHTTN